MKRLYFLIILLSSLSLSAQKTATKKGPILTEFGSVFQIKNPELILQKDKVYKVIFDIYTNPAKEDNKPNPLLTTVARYLNMHAQHGVPAINMKVIVIMHGKATKNALDTTTYFKKFKIENPNQKLMQALKDVNVDLYVCGQSYLAKGFELKNKSDIIKLSLSALTALVEFQSQGYQLITFN